MANSTTLASFVETLGRAKVMELAVEWWRESRHHSVSLEDLDTAIPDWDSVLLVAVQVVCDPVNHPLRVEPAMVDLLTYVDQVAGGPHG